MAAPAPPPAPPPGPEPGTAPPPQNQPKDDVGTRKGFRRYKWEFKDSNKEFWTMGHAEVKILCLGCMIAGIKLFETVATHPILILLLTMEVSIFTFFIFLYSFALNRYILFVYWPITDLFNDLFSCVFLVGGVVFATKARRVMPKPYLIAVILMGIAAFFAVVDLCLQRRHLKGKKIRKYALLAPDKNGKMPDPKLQAMLEAKEEEEARQKEKEEKEKLEREKQMKEKEKKEKEKEKKKQQKKQKK
ncbi:CKLF-like MARVEL transmembrane domain-containing protein 2B [Microtus ochrogaster]|uniref:CKLF-like MARVEL transmembrane domain-containing protein 2B n=1 Tax=Microtus ochrogaster TaxID=79684 RepID=A0A8J6G3S5_MICOH|nr:CKLF-like MARVEL transmembrane domain-containing protein 2B [Microtus ochrogaster]